MTTRQPWHGAATLLLGCVSKLKHNSHEASIALHCRVWPHRMVPGSRSLLDLRPAPVDLRRELRMG